MEQIMFFFVWGVGIVQGFVKGPKWLGDLLECI